MKSKILAIFALVAIFISACEKPSKTKDANVSTQTNTSINSKDELSADTQIGLRKTNLQDEDSVKLLDINYTGVSAGESILIDRSFENAPPIISHTTQDMLPITKENNTCISCHDKAFAADLGATAMPATHYFDYRTDKSTGDVISETRFNCTICHIAQSDAKPLVQNTFKANFDNNESLKTKSNLIDVMNEGVR